MSQTEVYEFLKRRRESGDDNYYTPKEIREMLNLECTFFNERSINQQIWKLYSSGFLERADPLDFKRALDFKNWSVAFRYCASDWRKCRKS